MCRKPHAALLAALLLAVPLALLVRGRAGRGAAEVRFASAEELLRLAGEDGLHCYPGSGRPTPVSGHFVTDRPRDPVELYGLGKGTCGQSPEWDGVVWACDLGAADHLSPFDPAGVGGNGRALGRVFVAGDERLIRRLEELHRRRAGRSRGR
jgi:hypothetical protein